MTTTPTIEKASFFTVINNNVAGKKLFDVHFNPQSLQYTITNTLKNTGSGNSTIQYTGQSTGKLTFDLIFDTTSRGEDVRLHTVKVAKLMEPGNNKNKTPPTVMFEWGLYTFIGLVESYKETIDFFSFNGVPLRASVNLTLSSQKDVFKGGSDKYTATTDGSMVGPNNSNAVEAPAPDLNDGRGVTQTATKAGNPAAARQIAAQNGIENMRFPGSGSIKLNESFNGIENMGFPASGSIQLNASLTATGVASMAGVNASAGGVFAGLRSRTEGSVSAGIELSNFLRPSSTASLGIEDPSAFAIGGQASLQGSASIKADVGKAGALKSRIEFDGGE